MDKEQILSLVEHLSLEQQDADTTDLFFDGIIERLASLEKPAFVEFLLKIPAEYPDACPVEFDFEDDMIRLLAMFFDDKQLTFEQQENFEAYSGTWRNTTNLPIAYTTDEVSAAKYRVYPKLTTELLLFSEDLIPTHGEPFGEDFPANWFTLIYAQRREDDIEDYYALPIALDVVSREFEYHSRHQDLAFSEICKVLSKILFNLIGV